MNSPILSDEVDLIIKASKTAAHIKYVWVSLSHHNAVQSGNAYFAFRVRLEIMCIISTLYSRFMVY